MHYVVSYVNVGRIMRGGDQNYQTYKLMVMSNVLLETLERIRSHQPPAFENQNSLSFATHRNMNRTYLYYCYYIYYWRTTDTMYTQYTVYTYSNIQLSCDYYCTNFNLPITIIIKLWFLFKPSIHPLWKKYWGIYTPVGKWERRHCRRR